MAEDAEEGFGPDFYTVEDEEGNQFELELIDTLEHNGILYHAFFPATPDDEEEEVKDIDEEEEGLVLLKMVEEDGEEILSSLDSDEEIDEIYELFMERFLEEEED